MVKKAFLLLLVLLLLLTIGCWVILTEFSMLNWSLTGLFLTVLIINIIWQKESLLKRFSPHLQKRLASELTTFFFSVAIVSLLAYLISTFNLQMDLSSTKENTLSDKTVKIVKEIDAPLKIQFFTRREYWKNWKSFFYLFQIKNPLIKYEYINIETAQSQIESKGINKENTAVLYYKGKEVKAVLSDELSVSNAILKIIGLKRELFYFLTGHGELSLDDKSKNGLSYLKGILDKEGHQVSSFNLTKAAAIDLEAILIIPFLKEPLLASELNKIKKFMKDGGRFIFLQGISFSGKGYASLNDLLKEYGTIIENKMTIDRLATVKGEDPSLPVIEKFSSKHPIVQGFKDRLFFPLSSSIKIDNQTPGIMLAETAKFPASWAESELKDVLAGKAKFDAGDTAGPITLALALRKGMNRGVVIGSHYLISNQYQNHSPQFNFFLNAVDWIIGQEKMASLNRPTLKLSRIYLSDFHLNIIFYGSVIIGPLMLLLLALTFFLRRRSL